jgi:protein-disulfide isomerase
MLARCAGPKNYFPVVETIFTRQASMYQPGSSRGAVLVEIAKSFGIESDAFQACIHDQTALDALNARSDRHAQIDGIESTPVFFVNGTKVDGEMTLAQLDAAIAPTHHRR